MKYLMLLLVFAILLFCAPIAQEKYFFCKSYYTNTPVYKCLFNKMPDIEVE